MASHTGVFLFVFLLYLSYFKCDSRDVLTPDNLLSLSNGETLVSAGEIFELGFFTPASNNNYYVGIWYKVSPKTVVWVANRDNPIPFSTTELFVIAIDDGNLKVLDSTSNSYFSTQVATSASSSHKAKLLDSGNLVLIDDSSGKPLWQSFDEPTDTFLPGMRMDNDFKLTAWNITQRDPSTGNYMFGLNQAHNEYTILQKTVIHWKRSAPAGYSNPLSFNELPSTVAYMLSNFSQEFASANSLRLNFSSVSFFNYTRLLMKSSGEIQSCVWDDKSRGWLVLWSEPQGPCDVYDACGKFGICDRENILSMCKCLPGFSPTSPDDWMSGNFVDGCSRKPVTTCNKKSESDTFLIMSSMKFEEPDLSYSEAKNEDDCRKECVGNCRCVAYWYEDHEAQRGSSSVSSRCSIWTNELHDLQDNYRGGFNLSVRVAMSDIEVTRRNCRPCGPNVIPYPLSSEPHCGDPSYYSFACNDSTGEVSFQTLNVSYPVIDIDIQNRTFLIQVHEENSCDNTKQPGTQVAWLNQSLPFRPINRCYNTEKLQNHTSGQARYGIRMIMWEPPLEPTCITSADCEDWPNSSCNMTGQGKRRCLCNQYYQWDGSVLNCTTVHAASGAWSEKLKSNISESQTLIISISLTAGIVTMCSIGYLIYRRKKLATRKAKEIILGNWVEYLPESGTSSKYEITEDDKKRIDVPFFSLKSILIATDKFSDANRLGQGGFGPVYKGIFPQGQEMAVKRLSSHSSQGAEEFKNEVMLIAKLQHRNLVRLLGYCIEANEKILLYEYMPNKSLDTFIFDHTLRQLLDWKTRFDIILGIARGLLYLHHDSRLRIIHRDLKTSNILLDEEMNAKISDFGLARIVEGKSIEANTEKVAGTYGYLSPEYALEGLFSIKSDVFAFGVVVLEIISGKRNLELFEATNLLGHAWKLWMENKALDLMDPILKDTSIEKEALKCINVALLCVQEYSGDRPTMSNVIIMLGSESITLPRPNQPAFVTRRNTASTSSSSSRNPAHSSSINEITITVEQGR